MVKQVDLILSGGGQKCLYQISFIKALMESNKVEIRNIYGCSAGSIVSAFAIGNKLDYLIDYFFKLPSVESQLSEWNWFSKMLLKISKIPYMGWIATVTRFVSVLFFHGAFKQFNFNILDELDDVLTDQQKKDFDKVYTVATSLETGENVWFRGHKGDNWKWQDAVKASCALMPIVPPYQINEELYVDGGINDICALELIKNDDVDKIIVTYDYLTRPKYTKSVRQGSVIIQYLQDLLYLDMARLGRLQLKCFLESHKNAFVYKSDISFDSILDWDLEKRKKLYEDGVNSAQDYLKQIQ